MSALQSAPPSPGPPGVALLALVVVGVVVGALGSAVVRRLSNPVARYRLLYGGVLLPLAFLAYVLLVLLEFGPAVVASLGLNPQSFAGTLLADFVGLLAAGVVWLAAYAPTVRGLRAVRGVDLRTGRALVRMGRFVLVACALVALAISPLRIEGSSPLSLAGAVAVLVVAFVLASPWLMTLLRDTSTPTGATADRLADLAAHVGLDVRDLRVLDTDDEETASAYVRGPPGYRRLFVTSTFLEQFDDDTAAAILAVKAGSVRANVLEKRVGTVLVAAFPLVAAVTGTGRRWLLLAAALGAVLVGFWLTRRAVRAADEYAAERVGADAVADALERHAEVNDMQPTRRRVPNPLSVNVATGDRIDYLRE